MDSISDRQWEVFFQVIDVLVDSCAEGNAWQDARKYLLKMADKYSSTVSLEEVCSWISDYQD